LDRRRLLRRAREGLSLTLTRRGALVGAASLAACAQQPELRETYSPPPDDPRFAEIERRIGGRVGVAALNTADGAWLTHRAGERFAMCSTFKWLLAAQMLYLGQFQPDFLEQRMLYNEEDLLSYAPVTRRLFEERANGRPWAEASVAELAEAAAVTSDNTAANLLLAGPAMEPAGLTRFLRENGDAVTRLDRYEIEMNDVPPGDERDTTTPEAMARTMRRFLTEDDPLDAASRERLIGWLISSRTGLQRLRGGLPADWRAGDKTGTWIGEHNATNDVAIAWPPGRAPIIIACYLSQSDAEPPARNAAHAEVARIVAEEWSA
ncbi:MAG: class A beta-lactamase, partial [Hyphomonadaceae bacterium]